METRDASLKPSIEARIKKLHPDSTIELVEHGLNGPCWHIIIPGCPLLESEVLDAAEIWVSGIEFQVKTRQLKLR